MSYNATFCFMLSCSNQQNGKLPKLRKREKKKVERTAYSIVFFPPISFLFRKFRFKKKKTEADSPYGILLMYSTISSFFFFFFAPMNSEKKLFRLRAVIYYIIVIYFPCTSVLLSCDQQIIRLAFI